MRNSATSEEVDPWPHLSLLPRPGAGRHAGRVGVRALEDQLGDWRAAPGPTYRSLARAIQLAVERGALVAGWRLPSERSLATHLGVSRGTVVTAFEGLVADGFVVRRQGSGTYVAAADVAPAHDQHLPAEREGSPLVHHLVEASDERRGARTAPTDVIDLSLSVIHDAHDVRLPSLTPAALRAFEPATGYSPWGLFPLRAAIADHLGTRWGMAADADEIVITTGAQQAIAASASCWVRPGDTVVVDDPTYPGAIAAFRQAGAELVGVPVDRYGVRVDALRPALASRPALVYVQSLVHSPTGVVLAESRRREIAQLVARAHVPLVEDAALADTAAAADAAPPIAAYAADASIALVGSLSKLFWGGLRLGFVRAPHPLARRFARVKATHDLGSSAVAQVLALRLLTAPGFDRWLAARHRLLGRHREALAAALRREVPSWSWTEPAGGLSLWVRLPAARADELAAQALRHGVLVAAAGPLSVGPAPPDRIRLSYAAPAPDLEEAARRLARAWRAI